MYEDDQPVIKQVVHVCKNQVSSSWCYVQIQVLIMLMHRQSLT